MACLAASLLCTFWGCTFPELESVQSGIWFGSSDQPPSSWSSLGSFRKTLPSILVFLIEFPYSPKEKLGGVEQASDKTGSWWSLLLPCRLMAPSCFPKRNFPPYRRAPGLPQSNLPPLSEIELYGEHTCPAALPRRRHLSPRSRACMYLAIRGRAGSQPFLPSHFP